jgi:hypothetical protein
MSLSFSLSLSNTPHNDLVHFCNHAALMTLTLFTALPVAVALFPQYGRIHVSDLEEKFHNLPIADRTTPTQPPRRVEWVVYNKGL